MKPINNIFDLVIIEQNGEFFSKSFMAKILKMEAKITKKIGFTSNSASERNLRAFLEKFKDKNFLENFEEADPIFQRLKKKCKKLPTEIKDEMVRMTMNK